MNLKLFHSKALSVNQIICSVKCHGG